MKTYQNTLQYLYLSLGNFSLQSLVHLLITRKSQREESNIHNRIQILKGCKSDDLICKCLKLKLLPTFFLNVAVFLIQNFQYYNEKIVAIQIFTYHYWSIQYWKFPHLSQNMNSV